ncbi:ARM repeat-containing protein [Nadsonia fulvescens var. elongata DSM 6958]|uniref:ARM repeat-containing protein n=1 Tax=Nadsonia fulvescens var. elongata DSM 6958 TaxID=857566 RepID=A0A1E3PH62_9ASCO|nr:ARM repeat-containing protein [Nadsonia fulvescens var. elongata DSM 6958]
MNPANLHDCFLSTLNPDAAIRHHAENTLKEAELHPEFIISCLQITVSVDVSAPLQSASAVYLKNRVIKGWPDDPRYSINPIPTATKLRFRQLLISVIGSANPRVLSLLSMILNVIVLSDFPHKWPGFFSTANNLLNSTEPTEIYSGVLCVLEILRYYLYRQNTEEVSNIVFPRLLEIALDSVTRYSYDYSAAILWKVFKCFKISIRTELPAVLMNPNEISGLFNVFLPVILKTHDQANINFEELNSNKNAHVKCHKWAYRMILALVSRYVIRDRIAPPVAPKRDYVAFSHTLTAEYLPKILEVYIKQLNSWTENPHSLSVSTLSAILQLINQSVKNDDLWEFIKPRINFLVSKIIFVLLKPDTDDFNEFLYNPQAYILAQHTDNEELAHPELVALKLLETMSTYRKKEVLDTILEFVTQVMTQSRNDPSSLELACAKDSGLRMLSSLSRLILSKGSPIASQVQGFLEAYVMECFDSNYPFLVARACQVFTDFASAELSNQALGSILNQVLGAVNSDKLVVRFYAIRALESLTVYELVCETLSQSIPNIVEILLNMMKEIDSDMLANIMEGFVEKFSEELSPFAIRLSESLRLEFFRLVTEIDERNSHNINDPEVEDKETAALGVLSTLSTLLLTLESKPDMIRQMEDVLVPLYIMVLENYRIEYYPEIFELIDSGTYYSETVSPVMWKVFELMFEIFQEMPDDCIDEVLPSFENFIVYGSSNLKQSKLHLEYIYSVIYYAFSKHDNNATGKTRNASRLAQLLIFKVRGEYMDAIIAHFLNMSTDCVLMVIDTHEENRPFLIYSLRVLLSCIFYDPNVVMAKLASSGRLEPVIKKWLANIRYMKTEYDLKLNSMVLLSIVSLPLERIPHNIKTGLPILLSMLSRTLTKLKIIRNSATKPNDNLNEKIKVLVESVKPYSWSSSDHSSGSNPAGLKLDPGNPITVGRLSNAGSNPGEIMDSIEEPALTTATENVDVFNYMGSLLSHNSPENVLKSLLGKLPLDDRNRFLALLSSISRTS